MAKNREISFTAITSRGIFKYNAATSAAALAAYKAQKDVRGITVASPSSEADVDLTIPYGAINRVSWNYKETDNDIEDENCKVMTPEQDPMSGKLIVINDSDYTARGNITLSDTTINGTYGDVTFTDGKATSVSIEGHGAKITISGLPNGITYNLQSFASMNDTFKNHEGVVPDEYTLETQ